jgi:Subtilase family
LTSSAGNDAPGLQPELVVVAHPEAQLRLHGTHVQSAAASPAPLEQALAETRAHARPLFGPSEERVRVELDESPWDLPDLSLYYHVSVEADHEAVAARLNEEESIAGAYVKAPVRIDEEPLPASVPADADAPPAALSPDFGSRQGHLDAAPGGVNARTAWEQPGGDGTGVQVVVVGGAWRLTHEDLVGNMGGIIGGQPIDAVSFRNHGTAVLGLVRAARNDHGVTGVAPACQVRQVATFGLGTARAIRLAADALVAGGILLIEWQRPGPGSTGVGSAGFLPLEWWPDDFAAIAYATAKGVIVVEPAGNGSVSLDDPFYDTPAPGFPATWKNPFDRSQADCGAILVGAGAPPPGTHGHDRGPDRSRLAFSNVGTALDAQGWGAELTTLAYGDLQGGPSEDVWYTDSFGGTSGAAALVAGVAASLQGLQLAGTKRPPLTPADVRRLLRESGTPQQDSPEAPAASHRIGSRPDLLALQALLVATKDESKDSKDGKDGKDSKDQKDFKDDKEGPDKLEKDSKDGADNKDQKDDKDDIDHKVQLKEIDAARAPIEGSPSLVPETDQLSAQAPVVSDEPVRHFIVEALRPELFAAYLSREPDFRGRDAAEIADELRPPDEVPAGV